MQTTTDNKLYKLRNEFQSLDLLSKQHFIRDLSHNEQLFFYQNPDLFLFDKQIIPDGNWIYYLLRCGRSFGKTFAGSAWVAKRIRAGAKIIGLCGPTYDDVAKVMVPAIMKWFLPREMEAIPYNHQTHTLRFRNGAVVYCYTSDKEIRGPNLEYSWCDEICIWADGDPDKIKIRFEDFTRAVRVGAHPQTIITSTPKTHPFFIDFEDKILSGNPNYVMVQGSMLENPTLPASYIEEQIKTYGNSGRGRQEIYGDLIRDAFGAYWTHSLIDNCRSDVPAPPVNKPKPNENAVLMGLAPKPVEELPIKLIRTGIGFDPSVSKGGDECGILIGSLYSNGKVYITGDYSGSYDPGEWVTLINKLYKDFNAAFIVVETNIAGNTLGYSLRSKNAHMNVIDRHVSQGKTTRAEHCAALYSQGKVFHTSIFKQLEDQMCSFNVNYSKSPDRVDALGLVLTELFWPEQRSSLTSIKNLPGYNR